MIMLFVGERAGPFAEKQVADSAPNPHRDFIDVLTRWVECSRPYSWRSLTTAVLVLLFASVLRASFGRLGSHFPLTFYFPAILAAGVLAGMPAAIGTALASIVIVWWVFIPPYLGFAWPKAEDFTVWLLFTLASSLTLLIAWLCRLALIRLQKQQLAYRTVARELQHRSKNAMAVTEVVVKKTLPHDQVTADAILGRLRAIGYANDLLTNPLVQNITLKTIIGNEFVPFGDDRFRARGPVVQLPPGTARYLILLLHEFVTNAAKYGALSRPSGLVWIDWQTHGHRIAIKWREQGGPPVQQPVRRGFGSALVDQSVHALSGEIEPNFLREGFVCSLTFTLQEQAFTE